MDCLPDRISVMWIPPAGDECRCTVDNHGFDNNSQARRYQDVGLDGMNDEDERIFYAAYLETLRRTFGENSKVYREAWNDPAGDNYHFFRGSDYEALETPVLERYKQYNGTEGNSPTADMSPESYPTAATTLPDVEDINGDNTLNETKLFSAITWNSGRRK